MFDLKIDFTGDWRTAKRALNRAPLVINHAIEKSLRKESEFLRTHVVQGIVAQAPGGQAFKPLSPYTIAMRTFLRRRSTKALIERGDLLRGIKVYKIDSMTFFVGVKRGVYNREGKPLVNIGVINEFGSKSPVSIRMTPAMRRYLAMAFRKMGIPYKPGSGDGFIHFVIPPRPFLGPVFKRYGSSTGQRVLASMEKNLRGVIASP